MQDDPVQYWQDLTDNYRRMSDGELLLLAERPEELTDVAQQVLRDEMKLRNLTVSKPESLLPPQNKSHADIRWEPMGYAKPANNLSDEAEVSREYTWKTKLCDCETRIQAAQLAAALQRAGIDTWIQVPRISSDPFDLTYPRIVVAADQLGQAQAIAAQPIPQDIIDDCLKEAESEPSEFEVPRCPKCGAPDAVLCPAEELEMDPKPDDKDWGNLWFCEACGAEWTDSASADRTPKQS